MPALKGDGINDKEGDDCRRRDEQHSHPIAPR
jgi:hypothetical protein